MPFLVQYSCGIKQRLKNRDMVITITKDDLTKMASKLNFGPDLTLGKIGEKMSRQYFEQIGGLFIRESEEENDELKKFDFEMLINELLYKIENKMDTWVIPDRYIEVPETGLKYFAMGQDNGNLFVEFSSRGKDSGINATESDLWVNFFHHLNEIWIIRVSKLRKLIRDNDFEIFYNAGDENSRTHGYLIKRELFREHFKVVEYERVVI